MFLYAFGLLELNGDDYRAEPLGKRKAKLEKLLSRRVDGIMFKEHLSSEGAVIFKHACKLGLEGIVSKRQDAPALSQSGEHAGHAARYRHDYLYDFESGVDKGRSYGL